MRAPFKRAATLMLAAASVLVVHGCTEDLTGGAACPILCPGQNVELRDILIAGVALDTTLVGYPQLGEELLLALTNRGDTVDTRVIIRFDTIPSTFTPQGQPSAPIDYVEDAFLKVRVRWPIVNGGRTMTVDAYDVDTPGADPSADTSVATLRPLFRQDRFLGSVTFDSTAIRGDSTLRVPIDNAYLLSKIRDKQRLRVGLAARGAESVELVLQGVEALRPESLSFKVTADQNGPRLATGPYSATPAERFIAADLADFVIVAHRLPSAAPSEIVAVGGIAGRRTYMRFDIPSRIIDSTAIVRATLELTQYPNRLAARADDSIFVEPRPVVASSVVTDLKLAATLLGGGGRPFRLDSLKTAPADTGLATVEVVGLVQVWRQYTPAEVSRALVLKFPVADEGVLPDPLYFFSTEAEASLRPRLRIVYVPRVGFDLP